MMKFRSEPRWKRNFSALQRAENSSMSALQASARPALAFQCSSASRKFLNTKPEYAPGDKAPEFQCSSASRKFLNLAQIAPEMGWSRFQCSSASRKFLNAMIQRLLPGSATDFSALQRAENSSIRRFVDVTLWCYRHFSALQRAENSSISVAYSEHARFLKISVLFSEPKIPQSAWATWMISASSYFSALQRAENSSIKRRRSPRLIL